MKNLENAVKQFNVIRRRGDVRCLDRFHCLQLLVSVLVLQSSNAVERVRMMNHWILTAIELRHSTIGNLYSFSAVMHSLLSSAVGFGE